MKCAVISRWPVWVEERQLEQARPVEGDEAHEEEGGREDRVAEHGQQPRVDDAEHHLTRAERAVARAAAAMRSANVDRRAQHEEDRHDHRLDHVQRHVPREGDPPVDAEHTVGRVEEEHPAEHPGHGARHGPRVTTAPQPHDAREVDADGEQCRRRGRATRPATRSPRTAPVGAGGAGNPVSASARHGAATVSGTGRRGPGGRRADADGDGHDDRAHRPPAGSHSRPPERRSQPWSEPAAGVDAST